MSNELADRYKETVLLPTTAFPMKANLPQTEPQRIQSWIQNQIHQKMIDVNKGKTRYVMPDGPPYANNNLHVGHALNKILKDITIKYRNMAGKTAAFIPGWDCHGLPIELNVTKALGPKRASTTDSELRALCRKEAMTWVEKQKVQFQRLGVIADWDHPYLTLSYDYEAEEVRVLADILKNGILYRGEKPVFWDPALQTAQAASEVEYQNHKSPSIFVKFALNDAALAKLGLKQKTSIVIWTTTPWTLPANYGVAVHPDYDYDIVKSGSESLIIASGLVESVAKACGLNLEVQKTIKGNALERLEAQHPFLARTSLIVLGEHVTLDSGTGCVHTAPAHGIDDYAVGNKYGLPVLSPVDGAGKYDDTFAEMKGVSIWEANKTLVEKMRESGALIGFSEIDHQYPYGPRSKKPLIYRATPQWFIRLDDPNYPVRKKALGLIESTIQFVPDWGVQRLTAMISNSPDWCLSRQRVWGVPIPVFYCNKCQTPLVKREVMLKVADAMESTKKGIDAYYDLPESQFTAGESCSKCKHTEFSRGKDILDVWFDSGVCHSAVQRRRHELDFTADVYIEGSDQHRGWFQTSLISAIAAYDKPPFKLLVTHGFVNDAQGYKMSKSLGNVVDPAEVIKDSGAEILRLWVAHENFGDDLTISKEMLSRIADTYRRFRNTIRFILGNLTDFDPAKDQVKYQDMTELDQWALHRLNELTAKCVEGYENFEFYKVYHALNHYFTVDLSATYLDILKDRLYTAKKAGPLRRSSQTVLFQLAETLCGLMAPVASFLAEETYSYLPGDRKESVFLTSFPTVRKEWQRPEIESRYAKLLEVRSALGKILEDLRRQKEIGSSLDAEVKVTAPQEIFEAMNQYQGRLSEFFIVSKIDWSKGTELQIDARPATGEKCVRCWHYDTATNQNAKWPGLCKKCVEALA